MVSTASASRYSNATFGVNAGDYGGEMGFLDVIDPKAPLAEDGLDVCKVEPGLADDGGGGFTVSGAVLPGLASKKKRVEGMPSKNLMADRHRCKRLNDCLSMLRSVVLKISKMDRTSILRDTIDCMMELLDWIRQLQEEIEQQQEPEAAGWGSSWCAQRLPRLPSRIMDKKNKLWLPTRRHFT